MCLVWVLSTAKVIAEGEDPKAERISTSLLEWTRLVLIAKWETPVPFAIFIGCFPGFCVYLGLIVFTCNSENFCPSAEATCSFWEMPVSLLSDLTSDWWRKKYKRPTPLYPVGETLMHSAHSRAPFKIGLTLLPKRLAKFMSLLDLLFSFSLLPLLFHRFLLRAHLTHLWYTEIFSCLSASEEPTPRNILHKYRQDSCTDSICVCKCMHIWEQWWARGLFNIAWFLLSHLWPVSNSEAWMRREVISTFGKQGRIEIRKMEWISLKSNNKKYTQ